MIPSRTYPVVCWWSGGVTSAVAGKLSVDLFGVDNCRFIMLDTQNEHTDTYRFKKDCEKWYGKEIEMIRNERFGSIQDVWFHYKSLNVANGAICSSTLKRDVRTKWQKENDYSYQVFGFSLEKREVNRVRSMKLNYPDSNPIFPLIMFGMEKPDCITYLKDHGIEIPQTYKEGLENNNCWQTGCVQGGIGYWQWMNLNQPEKFKRMAKVEHDLTDLKGEPVTICKDQSKGGGLVFLKSHPDYPDIKDISMMRGRPPEPLVECNGYCSLDDLNPQQPNNQTTLFNPQPKPSE